ncbi:MAG: hypothetical protein FJZ01_09855 [Candidatus Sericytochromatia bacterium]|nr:hypothetical protein [Candidatus Tanganyikabacteria bacterium]
MARIETYVVTVDTSGSAGSAAGNADSKPINGFLQSIFLDFHASAPGTTDTVVTLKDGATLLSLSNTASDTFVHPRARLVDSANATITDAQDRFPINGEINVGVSQCDALTPAVTAYLYVFVP